MATEAKVDATLWEKIGDGLTAFGEGVSRFLTRLLGASNERYVGKLGYIRPNKPGATHTVTPGSILAQINEQEEAMRALSDEDLRELTPQFREELADGATLDSLLPRAFAACREAARRTKNMRHFDTQMLGGVVLHRGNIAEMVTGEGKTLVATLPAYLNALEGKGVHVVTVNDYLARRDCEWMLPIYKALGITAGFIQSDMDPVARRVAYDCDITYGTNSEFGFDHLRDNMKPARWGDPDYDPYYQQCQRALNFAIIDEVDNILIDEARTPLIISGPKFTDIGRYAKANEVAVSLSELQKREPNRYFEVKEKEHTCHLTDEGIHKAEELAGVESFYTAGNMEWPHLIDNALRAHHLYKRDKQYAVMPDPDTGQMSIIIIDEHTGRLMYGRQWSDGLHQAVEAKHARDGARIKEETQTLATITLQNLFRMYRKICGMTGTAMTEADEFWKIYKLEVIAIPTNKPLVRVNHPDMIFRTASEKWKAVIDEIVEVHRTGRPILVGTTDVDKSLKLSELLKRRGIKHELLNALPEHAAREAEIIAQAGRIGAVTISTNMAGRGTDIILGGNPETLAWARLKNNYASRLDVPEDVWKKTVDDIEAREKMKEEGRKVVEMGGLHIIGTERHDARRIDNQLRGRAGRQGDPGSGRFYLSLEDDLMRIFAGEWVSGLLKSLGMEEGQAIESRMVSRRIQAAQKKVEERHFDSRKSLLDFDDVNNTQRIEVYKYRQQILEGVNSKIRILDMLAERIDNAVDSFLDPKYGLESYAKFAQDRLGIEYDPSEFARCDAKEAEQVARDKAHEMVETQVLEMIEENLGAEEAKEWNWQALAGQINKRWNLKLTDRQLKQMGKDNLGDHLREEARKVIDAVDLGEGGQYLDRNWGLQSLSDWARLKFQIKLSVEELADKKAAELKSLLTQRVRELYRTKEIEFPVTAAMTQYMSEKGHTSGGQKYNREGLYKWAVSRFPTARERLIEEDFRTHSRARLQSMLQEISKSIYPTLGHDEIDQRLDDAFEGTRHSEPEDARELAEWARTAINLDVTQEQLTGITREQARNVLWNAFDRQYRPEMKQMERGLLLNLLDSAWKNHLLQLEVIRSAMNLVWVGQIDAKTEYKREGMLEFKVMWKNIHDKMAETIFRMEETVEFQESLWQISAVRHDTAPREIASDNGQQTTNASSEPKKVEPIRNHGEKVGRNDPCPCGSGKKYKNCHMRLQAG